VSGAPLSRIFRPISPLNVRLIGSRPVHAGCRNDRSPRNRYGATAKANRALSLCWPRTARSIRADRPKKIQSVRCERSVVRKLPRPQEDARCDPYSSAKCAQRCRWCSTMSAALDAQTLGEDGKAIYERISACTNPDQLDGVIKLLWSEWYPSGAVNDDEAQFLAEAVERRRPTSRRAPPVGSGIARVGRLAARVQRRFTPRKPQRSPDRKARTSPHARRLKLHAAANELAIHRGRTGGALHHFLRGQAARRLRPCDRRHSGAGGCLPNNCAERHP
jgi:hypothetical protein